MKKPYIYLILFITGLFSCKSQRSQEIDEMIKKIDQKVEFNYKTKNNIRFDDLIIRLPYIKPSKIKQLATIINEKKIEEELFSSFYNNFSIDEIKLLFQQTQLNNTNRNPFLSSEEKNNRVIISESLMTKRKEVYKKIYEKDSNRFNRFKKEFFLLEAKNYEIAKQKERENTTKNVLKYQQVNRPDGIYEVIETNNTTQSSPLKLIKKAALSFKYNYIQSAKVITTEYSSFNYVIEIVFNTPGAKRFYSLTKDNIAKPLAIVVNKEIISAPIVNEPIEGGKISISGNFTLEEAKNIASIITSKI